MMYGHVELQMVSPRTEEPLLPRPKRVLAPSKQGQGQLKSKKFNGILVGASVAAPTQLAAVAEEVRGVRRRRGLLTPLFDLPTPPRQQPATSRGTLTSPRSSDSLAAII